MWASLVAVLGTVAGALVSGLLQHRATRSERHDARSEQLRRDRLEAVTALAEALSDHRRTSFTTREAVLDNESAERVRQLREASHATRFAVTAPAVRLRLLIGDETVRAAASAAIDATFGMRDAADPDDLQHRRRRAVELHDRMVNAAGAYLT